MAPKALTPDDTDLKEVDPKGAGSGGLHSQWVGSGGLSAQASAALQRSLHKSGSIRLKDSLMVAHMMQQEAGNQQAS